MTFLDAMKHVEHGNEVSHPGIHKGYVIRLDAGKVISHNPFNNEKTDYVPTKADKARTDWYAGRGLAAL